MTGAWNDAPASDPSPVPGAGRTGPLKTRASTRFWWLFALLFALIAVEGGVGLYVLADFKRSVEQLRTIQSAGMRIDEFGVMLNNYVMEMKVSTGLSQQGGAAVPLPPTTALYVSAARLGDLNRGLNFPQLARLLEGVDALIRDVGSYHRQLAERAFDEATLDYIQQVEPLADRLLAIDFPSSRTALMREVERVERSNRKAGIIARRALVLSLVATLAIGLVLVRLIAHTFEQAKLQEKELQRRHSEMAIARAIQTSVLPRDFGLAGFDIGAVMIPATEVGGDFYEFRRTPDGTAWIGIGDVTGHGVQAGVIMMMAQSMFTMLNEHAGTESTPGRFLALLNRALFYNLKYRLGEDKFMTMMVARIFPDGRIVYAGAHTDLLVYRRATGNVDRIPTEGLWLGMVDDITEAIQEREVRLNSGDMALFHTDGVTEAKNAAGKVFDIERLSRQLREASGEMAGDAVLQIAAATRQWSPSPADDLSLMAIKKS